MKKGNIVPILFLVLAWVFPHHVADAGTNNEFVTASAKTRMSIPLPENPARLPILGSGLGFPFKNANPVVDIRSYGISPWGGEPVHNGIDLIVDNTGENLSVGDRVPVISPADGTVLDVLHFDNPHEPDPGLRRQTLVIIEINPSLLVTLTFEPKTADPALHREQANAISVDIGQTVRKGQEIGHLIVGEGSGTGSGNPHIDYRLLLKEVSTTIGDIIVSGASHNDVADLPTFLCPYDYSSIRAKALFERIMSKETSACRCPCKYPYNEGACGTSCID